MQPNDSFDILPRPMPQPPTPPPTEGTTVPVTPGGPTGLAAANPAPAIAAVLFALLVATWWCKPRRAGERRGPMNATATAPPNAAR